jgi:hypothetical protein
MGLDVKELIDQNEAQAQFCTVLQGTILPGPTMTFPSPFESNPIPGLQGVAESIDLDSEEVQRVATALFQGALGPLEADKRKLATIKGTSSSRLRVASRHRIRARSPRSLSVSGSTPKRRLQTGTLS